MGQGSIWKGCVWEGTLWGQCPCSLHGNIHVSVMFQKQLRDGNGESGEKTLKFPDSFPASGAQGGAEPISPALGRALSEHQRGSLCPWSAPFLEVHLLEEAPEPRSPTAPEAGNPPSPGAARPVGPRNSERDRCSLSYLQAFGRIFKNTSNSVS